MAGTRDCCYKSTCSIGSTAGVRYLHPWVLRNPGKMLLVQIRRSRSNFLPQELRRPCRSTIDVADWGRTCLRRCKAVQPVGHGGVAVWQYRGQCRAPDVGIRSIVLSLAIAHDIEVLSGYLNVCWSCCFPIVSCCAAVLALMECNQC